MASNDAMSPLLRRYLYLLLLAVLVPAGVQAALWIAGAVEDHRAAPPVKAARTFLDAFASGDCVRALPMLSAASRDAIAAQMRAERPGQSISTPRSCWTSATRVFHGLQSKSAQLASQVGDTAIVNIEHREADPKSFLIPGFWPTRYVVTRSEMRLVAESGAWRIMVP